MKHFGQHLLPYIVIQLSLTPGVCVRKTKTQKVRQSTIISYQPFPYDVTLTLNISQRANPTACTCR